MRPISLAGALLILTTGAGVSHAGTASGAVWVFLSDKGYPDAGAEQRAIGALATTYNPRAIARRELRRTAPGLFDARDLPVAAAYRAAIEGAGGRVRVESRWLNAVSVEAGPGVVDAIARLPFVAPGRAGARGGSGRAGARRRVGRRRRPRVLRVRGGAARADRADGPARAGLHRRGRDRRHPGHGVLPRTRRVQSPRQPGRGGRGVGTSSTTTGTPRSRGATTAGSTRTGR
jgi:hypothetical protein